VDAAGPGSRPYLVAEWSGGGGLGHYAYLLAEALAAEGADVTQVTRTGHELGREPGHPEILAWPAAPGLPPGRRRRIVVGLGRLAGWARFARVVAARRRQQPVVHLQTLDHVSEVVLAGFARGLGATVISTVHNPRPHDANAVHALVQRLGIRMPHAVIVHTEQVAEEVRRSMRPGTRLTVLGHPSYRRLVELFDRPVPPPRPVPRIGAIGMIRPYKGLEVVVETVARVVSAGTPCELRVAGRASDEAWVRSLLAGLPDGSSSTRLGYLPPGDFIDEVLACDVVLLGHRSLSESGIAQLALGAGVPVVGPRLGAIARLLEGRPEWVYEPGDVVGAAECVRGVLAAQARDRGALRAQALALSDAAPAWSEMARACLSLADGGGTPVRG